MPAAAVVAGDSLCLPITATWDAARLIAEKIKVDGSPLEGEGRGRREAWASGRVAEAKERIANGMKERCMVGDWWRIVGWDEVFKGCIRGTWVLGILYSLLFFCSVDAT